MYLLEGTKNCSYYLVVIFHMYICTRVFFTCTYTCVIYSPKMYYTYMYSTYTYLRIIHCILLRVVPFHLKVFLAVAASTYIYIIHVMMYICILYIHDVHHVHVHLHCSSSSSSESTASKSIFELLPSYFPKKLFGDSTA